MKIKSGITDPCVCFFHFQRNEFVIWTSQKHIGCSVLSRVRLPVDARIVDIPITAIVCLSKSFVICSRKMLPISSRWLGSLWYIATVITFFVYSLFSFLFFLILHHQLIFGSQKLEFLYKTIHYLHAALLCLPSNHIYQY